MTTDYRPEYRVPGAHDRAETYHCTLPAAIAAARVLDGEGYPSAVYDRRTGERLWCPADDCAPY